MAQQTDTNGYPGKIGHTLLQPSYTRGHNKLIPWAELPKHKKLIPFNLTTFYQWMAQQTDSNSILMLEQPRHNLGTTMAQPWCNLMLYKYYNLSTYTKKISIAQMVKAQVSNPGEPGSSPPLTLFNYFHIIRHNHPLLCGTTNWCNYGSGSHNHFTLINSF